MLKVVSTDKAPAAIRPYSQAIVVGDFLFSSGQIPLDAVSGEVVGTTIEEQAELPKNVLCEVEFIASLK